jgi:hypothetical protein
VNGSDGDIAMEDLTLALITLTSFVLLFVVAIFADRAGLDAAEELAASAEPVTVPVDESIVATSTGPAAIQDPQADVA